DQAPRSGAGAHRPADRAECSRRALDCGRGRGALPGAGGRCGPRPPARRGGGSSPCLPRVLGGHAEGAAMGRFVVLTLNGLTEGAIYAAMALVLVVIWLATRVVSFGRGAIGMFAPF